MTSINSSLGALQNQASPRAQMDVRIAAAVSSGTISSTDQKALSSTLDTIDQALSSDKSAGKDPSGMKDRIDALIQQQVDSGALSQDQADELDSFFAQGAEGKGGPGGPRGPGGMQGPPPPADASESDDSDDDATSAATSSASTGNTPDTSDLDSLISFLSQLRDTLHGTSTTTYGASATTSTSGSTATGLVLDTRA